MSSRFQEVRRALSRRGNCLRRQDYDQWKKMHQPTSPQLSLARQDRNMVSTEEKRAEVFRNFEKNVEPNKRLVQNQPAACQTTAALPGISGVLVF